MARGSNRPTVVRRYFFADGQPNTRTGKFVLAMQPLEYLKDAFRVFFSKPRPLSITSIRCYQRANHSFVTASSVEPGTAPVDNPAETAVIPLQSIIRIESNLFFIRLNKVLPCLSFIVGVCSVEPAIALGLFLRLTRKIVPSLVAVCR